MKTTNLIAGFISLFVLISIIGFFGWSSYSDNTNPQIYSNDSYTDSLSVDYVFPFKNTSVTVSVSIPASTYYGAISVESKRIPYMKWDNYTYYSDFTNDPLQESIYTDILAQLISVKQTLNLMDDEYVELLSTFVQNISYYHQSEFRYPVETIVEKRGDCDDKSILLAGLLTRAGYDAVLLIFDTENHATVGIRTNDATAYPNTGGYAIIETTNYNYVTDKSIEFENNLTLSSIPTVISVGTGVKTYTSGSKITVILEYKDTCSTLIDQLAQTCINNSETVNEMEDTLTDYECRLSSLETLMNTSSYAEYLANDYYAQYEALYTEYKAYHAEYLLSYVNHDDVIDEHNRYIDIYNLIIAEPYNREYVYQKVLFASQR